jgi:CheY-like chemotaxis protein
MCKSRAHRGTAVSVIHADTASAELMEHGTTTRASEIKNAPATLNRSIGTNDIYLVPADILWIKDLWTSAFSPIMGTLSLLHYYSRMENEDMSIVVVVVEDEAMIRLVVADALIDAGFEVLEARHAEEAVTVLQIEAPRVHALFTDVDMPGEMNGIMLAHHTRRSWPWISLLVTSGLASPEAADMPVGTRFIPKPYDIASITRHIREMAGMA